MEKDSIYSRIYSVRVQYALVQGIGDYDPDLVTIEGCCEWCIGATLWKTGSLSISDRKGQSKSLIDRLLSDVMATSLLSLLYSLSYFAVRKLYRDVRFIKSKYYDGWARVVRQTTWPCDSLACLLFFMAGFLAFYETKHKKNPPKQIYVFPACCFQL